MVTAPSSNSSAPTAPVAILAEVTASSKILSVVIAPSTNSSVSTAPVPIWSEPTLLAANLLPSISAASAISSFTIVPLRILAEVTAPSKILSVVTASSANSSVPTAPVAIWSDPTLLAANLLPSIAALPDISALTIVPSKI